MKCSRCDNEIENSSKYCNFCGFKIISDPHDEDRDYGREYSYLSILGLAMGLVSILKFYNIQGILISVVGIIVSKMGMDEASLKNLRGYDLAKIGFVTSIVSLILKLIIILFSILFIFNLLPNIFTSFFIPGYRGGII